MDIVEYFRIILRCILGEGLLSVPSLNKVVVVIIVVVVVVVVVVDIVVVVVVVIIIIIIIIIILWTLSKTDTVGTDSNCPY